MPANLAEILAEVVIDRAASANPIASVNSVLEYASEWGAWWGSLSQQNDEAAAAVIAAAAAPAAAPAAATAPGNADVAAAVAATVAAAGSAAVVAASDAAAAAVNAVIAAALLVRRTSGADRTRDRRHPSTDRPATPRQSRAQRPAEGGARLGRSVDERA